jgi:prepilin-type N-terminal cleavage/methylation domain-containing protein
VSDTRGFTVVEVVIAIVIFSLGVLGLAGTAASVTRMVGQSQRYSRAAAMATQQFEILRATTDCDNVTSGSRTDGRYLMTWTVSDVTNGKQLALAVQSPTASGNRTDTFTSIITCVR